MVSVENGIQFTKNNQTYHLTQDKNSNGSVDADEYMGSKEVKQLELQNMAEAGANSVDINAVTYSPTTWTTAHGDFDDVQFTNGVESFSAQELGVETMYVIPSGPELARGVNEITFTDGTSAPLTTQKAEKRGLYN